MPLGFYLATIITVSVLSVSVHSFRHIIPPWRYKGDLLHTAAIDGCVGAAEMMLRMGGGKKSGGDEVVHTAASRGNMEFLQLLSRYHIDMNEPNSEGLTPLYLFAKSGLPGSGQVLIRSGVGPKLNAAPERMKWTSLHWAVNNNNMALVKALVAAGANINRRSFNGYTPLDIAVNKKLTKVAAYLKKNKAETNNVNLGY